MKKLLIFTFRSQKMLAQVLLVLYWYLSFPAANWSGNWLSRNLSDNQDGLCCFAIHDRKMHDSCLNIKRSLKYANKIWQPWKLYSTEQKNWLFLHANKRYSITLNLAVLFRLINIIQLPSCSSSLTCYSSHREKWSWRKTMKIDFRKCTAK